MQIQLPESVSENELAGFANHIGQQSNDGATVFDFSKCRFAIPGAILLLLAQIRHRCQIGQEVYLNGLGECPSLRYLQRMNFFAHCGVNLDERFTRHSPNKRFVPISAISKNTYTDVSKLSTDIADCVFPELSDCVDLESTGTYDAVEYAVSEMVSNVRQHSRSDGFILAQCYPQSDVVRIAIADIGVGIRQSFVDSQPPGWCDSFDDAQALTHALKPQISSKMHLSAGWGGPVNAGVGLTLLMYVAKVTGGDFTLTSYQGFHQVGRGSILLDEGSTLPGTACALLIPRKNIKTFAATLDQAKQEAGLYGGSSDFSELFS